MRLNSCLKASVAAALVGMSSYGFGAGFALLEQSVQSMGSAFSNATTGVGTASTIAYNPAGLSVLSGNNAAIGFNQVMLDFEFENQESAVNFLGSDMLITGGNGGEAGIDAAIPFAFYAYGAGDLSFGLGVYAPFGLATEYEKGWVGRYHGVESAITVLNISPSVSYKLADNFAVGLGVNYQSQVGLKQAKLQLRRLQHAAVPALPHLLMVVLKLKVKAAPSVSMSVLSTALIPTLVWAWRISPAPNTRSKATRNSKTFQQPCKRAARSSTPKFPPTPSYQQRSVSVPRMSTAKILA
jgi:long-subunit fatty acid transport protein